MRTIVSLLLMLALASAMPFAAADERQPAEEPMDEGENAWVEDCPPDMMCAYSEREDENATRGPDDGGYAWVEDCPPDKMCAYAEPADDNATRGPEDCAECRGEPEPDCGESPCAYGPEDCIHCSQPPRQDTCMDGTDAGEACDDDVQYMAPPEEPVSSSDPGQGAPSTGGAGERDPTLEAAGADDGAQAVPGPAAALGIMAVGIAAALMVARRR